MSTVERNVRRRTGSGAPRALLLLMVGAVEWLRRTLDGEAVHLE